MGASTQQVFNDGSFGYGSFVTKIYFGQGSSSQRGSGAYVLDDLRTNRPLLVLKVPDEIGAPLGFVLTRGQVEGSCTIQIGASSNPRPQNGDWFTVNLDPNGENVYVTFVICNIDDPREPQGYFKANCTLMKVNNITNAGANQYPSSNSFTPN